MQFLHKPDCRSSELSLHGAGIIRARSRCMGARHFSELIAWRLADDLRQFVFQLTGSGPVRHDWKFRDQIRDSADGVPRNIAEGFGRYGHADFARFLTIAKSSLDETEDSLVSGHQKRYFDDTTLAEGKRKVKRTSRAVLGLMRYLRNSHAPEPFNQRRR